MTDLQLALTAPPSLNPDGIAALDMRVGQTCLTRSIRAGANTEASALNIPVAPLAFWFADNWWRLRWESRLDPPAEDWRMAHDMAAIGHGHAWPMVSLWGDRDRVMLTARANPPGIAGPVRMMTNYVGFVRAEAFETAADHLLNRALSIVGRDNKIALDALVGALRAERADPEISQWRRLEAICGFGVDEGPEDLIDGALHFETMYRAEDTEDALAGAPGLRAVATLHELISRAERGIAANFTNAIQLAAATAALADRTQPWKAAEEAAAAVRCAVVEQSDRRLTNAMLAELAGITKHHLTPVSSAGTAAYGLRLADGPGFRVMITAHWGQDRRFQFARAIADAIWSNGSSLGAITNPDFPDECGFPCTEGPNLG